jgi:Fe-S cluster biogenesis protein NfuA
MCGRQRPARTTDRASGTRLLSRPRRGETAHERSHPGKVLKGNTDNEEVINGMDHDYDTLSDAVSNYLERNFPQIAAHGGHAAILDIDPDDGTVWLQLGGACSGCGISPMTTEAIQRRMPRDIPEITQVHVDTAGESRHGHGGSGFGK